MKGTLFHIRFVFRNMVFVALCQLLCSIMEYLFEFYDELTIKSNTILNSSNMPNEAFIIVTVLDAGTGEYRASITR